MNYGFIGTGNMASAIIKGMVKSGNYPGGSIFGYNRSPEKPKALFEECGMLPCPSIASLVDVSDAVILAVKPVMLPGVLGEIAGLDYKNKLFITIAAGKSISYYEQALSGAVVIRMMPNINAHVCASTTLMCPGTAATESQKRMARELFETVGTVDEVEERLFAAFSAIGGASPAFTYLYIDALAEAGVRAGIPRAQAVKVAASSVLGSAKLTLELGEHPAELASRVCSPGGTTIEGVAELRQRGFFSAVHEAVKAVVEKDAKLGK